MLLATDGIGLARIGLQRLHLLRRVEDPLFTKVESFSPRNHAHHFRLDAAEQVEALEPYAREAYAVGCQEHLVRAPEPPRS